VSGDDRGYNALLMGQIAHMRGKVDEAIATSNETMLTNMITMDAKSLGHLLEARELALVGRGKEADAADADFRKMVEDGIGFIPLPFTQQVGKVGLKALDTLYENFVKDGYAKAGNWLVEQAGHSGGKTTRAYRDISSNEKAAEQMVKQMLESSAVAHEYYRRTDLDTQVFVVGDPPRVKPPHLMTRQEYDAFADWIKGHSRVPADFGEAQQHVATGGNELRNNLGAPRAGRDE
jgi:hypothetical protein